MKTQINKIAIGFAASIHFLIILSVIFFFIYQFFDRRFTLFTLIYGIIIFFFSLSWALTKNKNLECPLTRIERRFRKKDDPKTEYQQFWAYYLKKMFKKRIILPKWIFFLTFFTLFVVLLLRIIGVF
jgi:hypothetical protein